MYEKENINAQEVLGRTNGLLLFYYILITWYDMDRTQNTASNNANVVYLLPQESVYRTVAQQRLSLMAPLLQLSRGRGHTHTHTDSKVIS
jgi:hypothetical protein